MCFRVALLENLRHDPGSQKSYSNRKDLNARVFESHFQKEEKNIKEQIFKSLDLVRVLAQAKGIDLVRIKNSLSDIVLKLNNKTYKEVIEKLTVPVENSSTAKSTPKDAKALNSFQIKNSTLS